MPHAGGTRTRGLVWALGVLNIGLALYAYRALLALRPNTALSVQVEGWFFEPSDTAPPVVVGLALWLLYRRRHRLAGLDARPGAWPVTAGLLVGGLSIFAWAASTGAADLQALSLMCNALGIANLLGGRRAMRAVLLPTALLVFAMPLPAPLLNSIVWRFQIWAADYTGFLLYLLGLPALVTGDQILRSGQVFAFIETCSGLRSIETLTMLSLLMADLFRRRGAHALLLVAAAPFVAFAINGLRALAIMMNPHGDVAAVHSLQGILMLMGGILVLYAFDGLLERFLPQRPEPERPGAGAVGTGPGAGAVAGARSLRARLIGITALLAVLVVASFGVPRWELDRVRPPAPANVIEREIDGWRGIDLKVDRLFLGRVGLSQILSRRYGRGPERVDVFVATAPYGRFRSVVSPKTELPGGGWIIEERGNASHPDGRDVDELVVRRGTRRLLVHHWREGTSGLLEDTLRTLFALDASPWRRDRGVAVVRLATPLLASAAPAPVGAESLPAAGEGDAGADPGLADPETRRRARERLGAFAALLRPTLNELASPSGDAQ